MRQRIRVRERLPVWGLRLVFGVILLTLAELVMWQNPPARTALDWVGLLILYVALASILMDVTVRFQARNIPTILLVSGLGGLISAAIINHSAFPNFPNGMIVNGFGLQVAASLYGLLLFVSVMCGKQVKPLYIAGAVAIGVLWGVWVHWYPLQKSASWGLVPIETAHLYILPALILIGMLVVGVGPRFRFVREKQMELLWWEAVVAAVPLFVALIVGMIQDVIPFVSLVLLIGIGAFVAWALYYQRGGYEPSILAQMTFVAPNAITYIVLAIAFLIAGTLAYGLVSDSDSAVGLAVYLLAFAFGSIWLPGASLLIFWQYYRKRNTAAALSDDEEE
ncbi:MAG: hypothetical protein IT324_05350 [Anaerolineae bacterium]|nr:hypothetical protein [Anaerolineae bacterium]